MPWQSQVVYANQVIVSGGGVSGVFVYNGAPGLGNPPVFWVTENAVDPYGNVLPPSVGLQGGSFPFLVYSGAPATGNLIAAISTNGGTDPFGNIYYAGVSAINETSGQVVQLFDGQVLMFAPNLGITSGTQAEIVATAATFPNAGGELLISGAGTGLNAVGQIALLDSAAQGNVPAAYLPGTALILGNPNNVTPDAVNSLPVLFGKGAAGGHANYVSFDGGQYDMGRFTVWNTSALTVASTSPTTLVTFPAAAGTYQIDADISIAANGTGTPEFRVSTTMGESLFSFKSVLNGGTAAGFTVISYTLNTLSACGPALVSGDNYMLHVNGIVTFTGTSANVSLQMGATAAVATCTIAIGGALVRVMPATA
jgi:hypothetical protein